jgi:hypothetical protein
MPPHAFATQYIRYDEGPPLQHGRISAPITSAATAKSVPMVFIASARLADLDLKHRGHHRHPGRHARPKSRLR